MLFPTITFAIFFMIVLPVSWLLMPRRRRWKLFMLAASYFFYGYWDWRFCFLIAASTIVNQLLGRLIWVHSGSSSTSTSSSRAPTTR
jgi:D-alanyl-lipoteichoic acid acyltransferase DltB (MBOAT superfamily)